MLRRCAVHAVLSIALGTGLGIAPNAGATDLTERDLLTETFTLDEQKPLADAQAALATAEEQLAAAVIVRDDAQAAIDAAAAELATAQAAYEAALAAISPDSSVVAAAEAERDAKAEALADAEGELALAQADVDAKTIVRDEAVAVVEAIEAEIALTAELVEQLSAKQVHALNSSLNNAYKTGLLPLELDSASLQRILDGDFGVREIHALTMAYEAEARFDAITARLESRYDETGREHFAAHEAGQEHGKGLAKGHAK
jgi:hypothetical protein